MWLINSLDFIGSGLVLCGLVLGGWSLTKVHSRLEAERATIQRIRQEREEARVPGERRDFNVERLAAEAEMRKHGIPEKNFPITALETGWLKQDIELTVVNYLRPHLAWPFMLASLGTLCGLVRALLLIFGVGS